MTTRRTFLTTSATAFAAPFILPSRSLFGADTAPGRVIRLGHIGVGGQGKSLLRNFVSVPGARSVAIADPFRQRREAAGQMVLEKQGQQPKLYNDFRDMLADPDIDAVVIATPDHWHVPVGIAAVSAGKDVYVEKPLGHTLAQNKAMLDACEKYHRIFQYGTQQRSQGMFRRGIELVLNGAIGEIERIDIWAPKGNGGGSLAEIPVPDGLDYEMYLGPAPMKPCSADRITSAGSWYCSDYAIGFIAGWGAHPLDGSIWGLEHDIQGPYKVRGTGTVSTPDTLFNTITSWDVEMEYARGVKARFMSNDIAKPVVDVYRKDAESNGTTFFGPKGWVSISRDSFAASNPEWFRQKPGPDTKSVPYQSNYYKAFVDAVRDRTPSMAPIGDAVRSDAMSHLSVLAIHSGKVVVWDPMAYRILEPEELNSRMDHPIRGDWMKPAVP